MLYPKLVLTVVVTVPSLHSHSFYNSFVVSFSFVLTMGQNKYLSNRKRIQNREKPRSINVSTNFMCVCVLCMVCFNDRKIRFIVFLLFHFHCIYSSYVDIGYIAVCTVYTVHFECETSACGVLHTNEQHQVGKSGSFKYESNQLYIKMMYLLSWCFLEYLTLIDSRF